MDLILRGLFQHPHLFTLSRWLLAAVFLTWAGGKLRDRRAFILCPSFSGFPAHRV